MMAAYPHRAEKPRRRPERFAADTARKTGQSERTVLQRAANAREFPIYRRLRWSCLAQSEKAAHSGALLSCQIFGRAKSIRCAPGHRARS
jgi:hypothetical protein